MRGLTFAIDSDLGNVSLVAVAVHRTCVQLGLDDITAGQVELCIAEAATNSIRHAYNDEPGHTVVIALEVGSDQLHVEVSDSGAPMPAEQEKRLLQGGSAFEFQGFDRKSLPEGGRGLQIIHDLMDAVAYIRGDTSNRLRMTKQFLPPDSKDVNAQP